jgi:hypothetical protein
MFGDPRVIRHHAFRVISQSRRVVGRELRDGLIKRCKGFIAQLPEYDGLTCGACSF